MGRKASVLRQVTESTVNRKVIHTSPVYPEVRIDLLFFVLAMYFPLAFEKKNKHGQPLCCNYSFGIKCTTANSVYMKCVSLMQESLELQIPA